MNNEEKVLRFSFGENWMNYLKRVDEISILAAEKNLKDWLRMEDLSGLKFADIGCGSGLFSLAAYRLGANVYSIDYDSSSIACAEKLKKEFYKMEERDNSWDIQQGSVLDKDLINSLGRFDIVYSWGVLHHTGSMWEAIENAQQLVMPRGKLFISIYNDQGIVSRYWLIIKLMYNKNIFFRYVIIFFHFPYLFLLRSVYRLLKKEPIERGMLIWNDMLDWLGGSPFEVAKPEKIFDFLSKFNFTLKRFKTVCGKHGCNEFLFIKK